MPYSGVLDKLQRESPHLPSLSTPPKGLTYGGNFPFLQQWVSWISLGSTAKTSFTYSRLSLPCKLIVPTLHCPTG